MKRRKRAKTLLLLVVVVTVVVVVVVPCYVHDVHQSLPHYPVDIGHLSHGYRTLEL